MIGTKAIKELGQALERNLKKELRDQGHYLTGALELSIKTKYTDTTLDTEALDYIDKLDEGVPANQIDFSVAYIQELAGYVTKRMGFTGKKALQVATAIAKKHTKEGMPTLNSYQFSTTGERTFVISDSYNRHNTENEMILQNQISFELDDFIDKTFTETVF